MNFQTKILAKVEKISDEMPEIVKELKIETAYAVKKYSLDNKQARYMYNKSVSSGVLPKNVSSLK